jgi:hypothetical protein
LVPLPLRVAYFVTAGEAGPSESHRAIYRGIEKQFSELLPSVTLLLEREYDSQMAAFNVPIVQARFSFGVALCAED